MIVPMQNCERDNSLMLNPGHATIALLPSTPERPKLKDKICFDATAEALINGTQTVSRRVGWVNLEAGTYLQAYKYISTLSNDRSTKSLGTIRVVSVSIEPLKTITASECAAEGYPYLTPKEYVSMFARKHRIRHDHLVTRIEFELSRERDQLEMSMPKVTGGHQLELAMPAKSPGEEL